MRTGTKGVDLIKQFEGLRLEAYMCPAKVWTVGYGSTRDVDRDTVITPQEAEAMLVRDLVIFENQLNQLLDGVKLNQNQFDALVSFVYNLGAGNLSGSTLLRRVRTDPNDADIRSQFLRWTRAGGCELQGLVRRRKAEAELYFSEV